MQNWPFRLGFVILGILIAIVFWQRFRSQPPPEPIAVAPPVEQPAEPPPVHHPVVETEADRQAAAPLVPPEEPLPDLRDSDAPMTALLAGLFADQRLDSIFVLDHFIERFVVMVDNLPRQELPATHRPLHKVPGEFQAEGNRDNLTIAPSNARRYAPLLRLLEGLEKPQIVAVYRRLYPLFQEAYVGLGYPRGHFNDRLIEVIDHLLEAPQVSGPIPLVQPKALYLYADPGLESLSAGHKILVRIGPDNAARAKALLRAYRDLLVARETGR